MSRTRRATRSRICTDRICPCAKVAAAWLWGDALSWTQAKWETALANADFLQDCQQRSFKLARSLQQHDALPDNLEMLLWQTRLFGMTRRALSSDLQILVDRNWLRRVGQQFDRVTEFPDRPTQSNQQTLQS